jgi:DNA modification methylase
VNIETWPIGRPIPYVRNARKISNKAIDKVATSISEFGWRQPIVVDGEGVIIVGHTRLLAAKKLELAEVPVHVATGLTAQQVKAYRLMDNRSHEESAWDIDLVVQELASLQTADYSLDFTGFDSIEIAKLLKPTNGGLTDPDDAPPLVPHAITRPGETWVLGRHRLTCGDCTDESVAARAMAGNKPVLMVTDPPYGVSYDPAWRLEAGVNKAHQKRAEGKVSNDDRADWRAAWAHFPGHVAYVWHGGLHAAVVALSLEATGFQIRSQIIWAKPSLVIGRGHYHWQHEPCWYAVKHGSTATWTGDRKQATIWAIANMHRTQGKTDDGKNEHGTQKPVECMLRPMQNNTEAGHFVYDPFMGSGTTLIAAHQSGRIALGVELDPRYVDLAVRRWQAFTGEVARLEDSNDGLGGQQSFSQIESERKVA